MRRENPLAQLPSEIIHISLQQPSRPASTAPSSASIKTKLLKALSTMLKGRGAAASCGSGQECQEVPPDPASIFIPLEMFQASITSRGSAASAQTQTQAAC